MKNIKDMTLGEIEEHRKVNAEIEKAIGCKADELAPKTCDTSSLYEIGKAYLIRTVTFYYVGRMQKDFGAEIMLTEASWIPDTGRYSECLKSGKFSEIEKIPDYVGIPKSAIIDIVPWSHSLPTETK